MPRNKKMSVEPNGSVYARQRTDLAITAGRIGIWDWDLVTDTLYFAPNYYRMAGYEPDEFPASLEAWTSRVHPEDLPQAMQAIQRYLSGEAQEYHQEFRYLHKDGTWMWMLARGEIHDHQPDGKPARFTGLHIDITQRRVAELMLERERRFMDAVMDSIPGMLYLYDAQGALVRWNRKHEELTGFSTEELDGKHLLSWFDDPREQQDIMDRIGEAMVSGFAEGDGNLLNKDGSHTLYHFNAVRLELDGQQYFAGIGTNIEAQRHYEQQILHSEQRYRALFDNMLHGLALHEVVLDAEGCPVDYRYLDVNAEFCRQAGYTKEGCIGKSALSLAPGLDPVWVKRYGHVALTGETLHMENEVASLGKTFELVVFQPAPGQFAVLSADITERVRFQREMAEAHRETEATNRKLEDANRKLAETNRKVEDANRALEEVNRKMEDANRKLEEANATLERRVRDRTVALEAANLELNRKMQDLEDAQNELIRSERLASLGELVAGVAHEINTPIGVSVTAASFLEVQVQEFAGAQDREALPPAWARFLDKCRDGAHMILSNLERAARLIKSFKQVSADRAYDVPRDIDLRDYINELIISLAPSYRKTPHRLVNRIGKEMRMRTFPGALSQILTNLLMNALVHAFHADMEGVAAIEAVEEGDRIRLTFSDNGVGMPPEVLAHVFDPFFTTRRGTGGSGLGLFIVHNLVMNELKGTIDCHSIPGEGTIFEMVLPKQAG